MVGRMHAGGECACMPLDLQQEFKHGKINHTIIIQCYLSTLWMFDKKGGVLTPWTPHPLDLPLSLYYWVRAGSLARPLILLLPEPSLCQHFTVYSPTGRISTPRVRCQKLTVGWAVAHSWLSMCGSMGKLVIECSLSFGMPTTPPSFVLYSWSRLFLNIATVRVRRQKSIS